MYRRGSSRAFNASNLYDTFAREERREAEVVPLLADYTRLLGSCVQTRATGHQAIPFKTGHRGLVLAGKPPRLNLHEHQCRFPPTARMVVTTMRTTTASMAAPPAEQTAIPARDVSALRECFNCAPPADLDQESRELFQWFCEKLSPPGGHLKPVCRHWEKKLDGAKNCQEQVIMQSLFTQAECPHSLRPAHSIHTFDRYRGCAAP